MKMYQKAVLLSSMLVLLLAFAGCTLSRQSREAMPQDDLAIAQRSEIPESFEPCSEELAYVSRATSEAKAKDHLREWLNCLAAEDVPPLTDLESRATEALKQNPYPGTSRRSRQILAHFFDKSLLKKLPENRRETIDYIETLDDQGLVAKAQGDVKFASASDKRAKSLTILNNIVDMIEENE